MPGVMKSVLCVLHGQYLSRLACYWASEAVLGLVETTDASYSGVPIK
jgi:hypothetical protein